MFRITEKELFTYIFYPDELSEDIFNYISKNISKFSREIEMLAQLKKILDEEVPENVMKKISDKIEQREKIIEVKLSKLEEDYKTFSAAFFLAAQSNEVKSNFKSETYVDEEKRFLIKIISDVKKCRIFFFDNENEKKSRYFLRIYPIMKTIKLNSTRPIITENFPHNSDLSIIISGV